MAVNAGMGTTNTEWSVHVDWSNVFILTVCRFLDMIAVGAAIATQWTAADNKTDVTEDLYTLHLTTAGGTLG